MATIRFSGFDWTVKQSVSKVGPGPNLFSAANVTVDHRGLHLRIARAGAAWTCAEVVARGAFGYGTYAWTMASDPHRLDAAAVLGLFTWSDEPTHAHRELARWGAVASPALGLYTVQAGSAPNSSRFAPAASDRSTHTLTWTPGRVAFTSTGGPQPTGWTYAGPAVPLPGGGVAPRINLWLFRGAAPASPQGVTISTFSYTRA